MAKTLEFVPLGGATGVARLPIPNDTAKDFTFARSGTGGTLVNADGNITNVGGANLPRYDFLDDSCPSLLLEPATTNLITYSEEFDNVAWGKSGSSVTANSVLSPDGSVNADTLVSTNTTGSFLFEPVTVIASTKYNISFFAKKSNTDYFGIIVIDGSDILRQYYDINNGVVASTSVSFTPTYENVKIEDYGNGWYRCSLTYESVGTSLEVRPYVIDNDNDLNSASGSEVYIFGAQVEQQSYATSYVRSLSGVSGVRNAETCNGAGTTAEINSQEGVLFAEFKALAETGVNRYVSLNGGLSSERLVVRCDNLDRISCYAENNPYTTEIALVNTIDITEYHKVALYWSGTTLKFYVNGLFVGEDTSWVSFSSGELTQLECQSSGGSFPFHGRVKKLSVYDDVTTDLEALTGFSSFAEMASYLSYS